jgi:hypothetical protein
MTTPHLPQPRRVSPVSQCLKPVLRRIAPLQEAAAFLAARNAFASKLPENRVTATEVAEKRRALAEVQQLFDAAVNRLPEKLRGDTRLSDTLVAIERLDRALAQLDT